MSVYEFWFCSIVTVYTLIYAFDVCYTIYKNNEEDNDESNSDELPEYVKRMYS